MTDNPVFYKLLEKLEGDEKIFNIKDETTGLALWPFVRHRLLFYFTFTKRNFGSVGKGHSKDMGDLFRTLLFAFWKNALMLAFRKKKIWVFNSGITNVKSSSGYFNRLADYFYFQFPSDTALLEETAYGKHSLPRVHRAVYSHLSIRMMGKILAFFSFNKKIRKKNVDQLFTLLQQQIVEEHSDEVFLRNLKTEFYQQLHTIIAEYSVYKLIFKIGKPKLILVEDASYGSKAHLIKAAKDMSVIVAEFQHGLINDKHLAYNYGTGLRQSSYLQFLPDIFLTFGDMWARMINLPVRKISIGNPHLSQAVEKGRNIQKQKSVLVLGTGTDVSGIIGNVLKLYKRLSPQGYKIIFRPHPLEWSTINVVYRELSDNGIDFDTTPDLYLSLQRAEVVVGELSTAMYEAKAFGSQPIIIRNKFAESFGDQSIGIFPVLLLDGDRFFEEPSLHSSVDDVWKNNWQQQYNSFIHSVLKS